jgi:hypothetical protein
MAICLILKRAKAQEANPMWSFWIRKPWMTACTILGFVRVIVSIPTYLHVVMMWSAAIHIQWSGTGISHASVRQHSQLGVIVVAQA